MLPTKQRVDRLERIFGQYMTQTNAVIADLKQMDERLQQMMVDMKQQAAQDRQQTEQNRQQDRQQAEHNRQQDRQEWNERFEQDRQEWNERSNKVDERMERNRKQAELDRKQDRKEWSERFEQDRQEWNERFEQDRQQAEEARQRDNQEWNERFNKMEQDRKHEQREWNKRWGELANKLGTIPEDIVAPNLPRIAKEYFHCEEIDDLIVRRWVRNKKDRSKRREFDVIVVAGDTVIINETKATVKIEYIERFLAVLPELTDYFPEYQGKTIIPTFASLYLQDDIIAYLTKHNIYAMMMGDETMEIVNFQELQANHHET